MNEERAQEMQERMTREAVAMLVLYGKGIDVNHYEKGVSLIGKAWGIPDQDTQRRLDLIGQERTAVQDADTPEELSQVQHILPESELPMNASGMETLDNVWDLFETSIRLDDPRERGELLHLARELAECQNLLDWIEKTPAEQQLPEMVAP